MELGKKDVIILKCLVADDVPIIRKGIKEVALNVLGEDTEFFEAFNSNGVLNIVDNYDIDIALLDVEMPTVNDIETARKSLMGI